MARLNIALLISALPAALAFPKHWGVGHAVIHDRGAAYKHRTSTSIAPYGEYNSTLAGPTGTGTAYLVTVTVSPLPVSTNATGSSSASVAAPQSAESTSTCTSSTVTTTKTNRVTVTVQPSTVAAPQTTSSSSIVYSAISIASSSSIAAPIVPTVYSSSSASSSSIAAPIVPTVYSSSSASSAASSLSASSSSSSPVAHTYSAVSSSSSTLVASSTSTSVVSSTTALSSTAVAPSSSSSLSSSSSAASTPSSYAANTKRGLAYNTASLTSAFTSAPISWAYNWGDSTSGLPSEFEFVPMLWGLDDHTIGWITTADAAVSSGTGYLLGFNEPDIIVAWGGSGISTADAVTGWNTYMQPFAGGATKLGSPGVSNAPAPQGLGWLAQFVEECSGCQIDFLVIHWYCGSGDAVDSAIADFQSHVGQAITQANGKLVWITEFRYIGPGDESDFINQVLPWLDANTGVERYSYFMVSSGNLLTGTGLSATGEAYATAA